jgi:hypothetical protein
MLPDRTPESRSHALRNKLVELGSEKVRNDTSRPWRNVPVRWEPCVVCVPLDRTCEGLLGEPLQTPKSNRPL